MSDSRSKRLAEKLGMSHGAARNKLIKNLLWEFVCAAKKNVCFQCGTEILTIHDLSIEHKVPWEKSEEPARLFFDTDNIAYSHLTCNIKAANRPRTNICGEENSFKKSCSCEACISNRRAYQKSRWNSLGKEGQQELRKSKYLRFGC